MAGDVMDYIKKHPVLVGGVVIGGGGLLYLLASMSSSSSGASGQGTGTQMSGLYGEELQASAQQNEINAELEGQSNQLSAELQATTISAQSEQNLAQIAANETVTVSGLEEALGINQSNNALTADEVGDTDDLQAIEDQTGAAVTENGQNNATQQDEINAALSGQEAQDYYNYADTVTVAGEQAGIANDEANVAIAQSNNQAAVSEAQTSANVSIANITAQASEVSSGLGLLGKIL